MKKTFEDSRSASDHLQVYAPKDGSHEVEIMCCEGAGNSYVTLHIDLIPLLCETLLKASRRVS